LADVLEDIEHDQSVRGDVGNDFEAHADLDLLDLDRVLTLVPNP
jgi:hypothetical protein